MKSDNKLVIPLCQRGGEERLTLASPGCPLEGPLLGPPKRAGAQGVFLRNPLFCKKPISQRRGRGGGGGGAKIIWDDLVLWNR